MHLSSHTFIFAFLPLYFSVDTDSQQCFKNIHTKKRQKNHYCLPLLPGLPGILKAAHRFVCPLEWFSTHVLRVPRNACVSKPFYLLLYLCTKRCKCKATFPAAAIEQAKINKINFIGSTSFPRGGAHFYVAIYFVWPNSNYCIF